MEWRYVDLSDPYGPPNHSEWSERELFVRRPDSEIWVWFDDLPHHVCIAILARQPIEHSLEYHVGQKMHDYMSLAVEQVERAKEMAEGIHDDCATRFLKETREQLWDFQLALRFTFDLPDPED
jgi:hypothetical protein